MRILHIELGRHLYGGAKQVVYLINAIYQQDPSIEQLLVCAEGSEIARQNLPGCTIHALPYAGELDISILWRLGGLIRATRPRILHAHSRRGADLWTAIMAKRSGIPAVCTRRVDNPEAGIASAKYAQYSAVVSISEGVRKVVSQRCPEKVFQQVIHSSVDLTEFAHKPDRAWFNNQFDIPPGFLVVANFAQLIGRKGQTEIISAMQDVVKLHPNTICLLFGKGSLAQEYERQIEHAGLQHNVRLCGFTNDVARILPNIDLMVHPAHAEGLGVILLQAGACNVPVIASPSGGIPEIIINGQTGWLTPAGESKLLANVIFEALEDPHKRQKYAANLFHHVSTHFSTAAMAADYIRLYSQLSR
ncbi:glycosyltransferase family 4 protein [Alteromonas lipolytica]|uniref:Glycoside hydrolase n=1 Tax=Alteromonas lipolytica TaxID=1856405 RepID=A0A1E8FBA4_9ALTE|nr:glycosyltransferase family 4 protein [Alteromonas lipolytica]OFI33189.1 glycoside hydrolase [Alteromonas lipolytica]GGF61762.1 glycosyl transferase [Alteromonas lipolytica]